MQSPFKKKDFEGLETCFGIPLGNSVSRSITRIKDQIKEFTIVSVGTKIIKNSQSVRLSIDGSTCANNFGYKAFPTKQDAEEFLHKHQMITNIKNNLDFSKLSYQEVLDLHKKIFIK